MDLPKNIIFVCTAPVPFFHLSNQFICGKLAPDHQNQALDDIL